MSTATPTPPAASVRHVDHVGLWVTDLEAARAFYTGLLGGQAGARYANPRTGFASYFVSWDGGARVELMQRPDVAPALPGLRVGLAHLALRLGSDAAVDAAVQRLAAAGVTVCSPPRRTGDGYYEAVVQDPDGTLLELVG